jgi:hypothetical protein
MFFGRFGFIFLLMWISVCVDAMSIIVKPETIVSGSTYTLADLALVENGNAKSILDQIVIGVAAKPGMFHWKTLRSSYLKKCLIFPHRFNGAGLISSE